MNEYEKKIKALEEKVKILEETVETLRKMQMSEQMQTYLNSRTQTLKFVELINSLSDKQKFDLNCEKKKIEELRARKQSIDKQIKKAINSDCKYLENFYTDVDCFEYQIEDGIDSATGELNEELVEYIGKGMRITSYIGFDSEIIIIPKTINGLPVISIGVQAFREANFSQIIIPDTVIAIWEYAFYDCEKMIHINLPETLIYLGSSCFYNSGLKYIHFLNKIEEIPSCCCNNCQKLKNIFLGKQIKKIGHDAFSDSAITQVIIPENVESIKVTSFSQNDEKIIECAFWGKNTSVDASYRGSLRGIKCIYCLPGSTIQRYARENNIPVKPLSEFKSEE